MCFGRSLSVWVVSFVCSVNGFWCIQLGHIVMCVPCVHVCSACVVCTTLLWALRGLYSIRVLVCCVVSSVSPLVSTVGIGLTSGCVRIVWCGCRVSHGYFVLCVLCALSRLGALCALCWLRAVCVCVLSVSAGCL